MRVRRSTMAASEGDLIEWLRTRPQKLSPEIRVGIGDDAAVVAPALGEGLCLSQDLLVEEVDFQRRSIHPVFLGRKALRVNLSDLAAMGAQPLAALLGLVLPAAHTESWFQHFVQGFLEECGRWACPLVGGDLSAGRQIQISVTVLGRNLEGPPLLRSGARAGERVFLAGRVGLSRMGLQILRQAEPSTLGEIASEAKLREWAGSEFRFECLRAHFLPEPQLIAGTWLSRERLAEGAIDVSDGLATDLLRLARHSGLAVELDEERLEGERELKGEALPLEFLLNGGEDFALAFTVSPENVERLRASAPPGLPVLVEIGRMTRGEPGLFLVRNRHRSPYLPRGFDHFRS